MVVFSLAHADDASMLATAALFHEFFLYMYQSFTSRGSSDEVKVELFVK